MKINQSFLSLFSLFEPARAHHLYLFNFMPYLKEFLMFFPVFSKWCGRRDSNPHAEGARS